MKPSTCELCGRSPVETTVHHLMPREEGGSYGPTANLCRTCHKQIHALYTNKELAVCHDTIERLRHDEKISKYIKWIRKQPAETLVRVRKSNERKRSK